MIDTGCLDSNQYDANVPNSWIVKCTPRCFLRYQAWFDLLLRVKTWSHLITQFYKYFYSKSLLDIRILKIENINTVSIHTCLNIPALWAYIMHYLDKHFLKYAFF